MNEKTINADVTMGGSEGTLLANRYRVVRQLGQGGMGSVWLAADTQLDNREVAIKMLPSILVSNKRAYQQLKAEALVSLKLTHPNIAIVRAFEENNGNPFLVVDYIDGQTLDDYLVDVSGRADLCVGRDGARPSQLGLPESEVIRLLAPIAVALDYAHSKGVVHRDVKPGNVMIAKDGTPYILDFGIAREIQETMTRVTGKLSSGTLMYMSPEQLNGDAPSAAQDVYSFAAMAYECLTGAPPFSRGNVEYQIVNKTPAPLSPHFMKCGESVMAGISKKPEARPSDCSSVLKSRSPNLGNDVPQKKLPLRKRKVLLGIFLALCISLSVSIFILHLVQSQFVVMDEKDQFIAEIQKELERSLWKITNVADQVSLEGNEKLRDAQILQALKLDGVSPEHEDWHWKCKNAAGQIPRIETIDAVVDKIGRKVHFKIKERMPIAQVSIWERRHESPTLVVDADGLIFPLVTDESKLPIIDIALWHHVHDRESMPVIGMCAINLLRVANECLPKSFSIVRVNTTHESSEYLEVTFSNGKTGEISCSGCGDDVFDIKKMQVSLREVLWRLGGPTKKLSQALADDENAGGRQNACGEKSQKGNLK